ncbi:MAG TPA: hypothetical protein DIT13_18195 [Verrucomicrobiales bacterium]|nr:hypothetical protein [Verrucomicrobiales bacterium]HRJ07458.1 hypothetical protein [Prosthecobacter sp.]HRK13645.1 hypothetical protein [Prosthecobacter sp.]
MHRQVQRAILSALPILSAWLALPRAHGQQSFEIQELHTTLQVAAQKIQALEARLAAAESRNEALAQSAAAANQEAGELKERHDRLRGLLEGLGIAALENNQDQLQERLLTALGDLRVSEASRRDLADTLMELAEVSIEFARQSKGVESEASDRLSKTLARAEEVLVAASSAPLEAEPANLQDARVVSLKPELGIAVLSVGSKDGVKPGMPFEVFREDKPIAKILVTDVRRSVCGAVVQELASKADPVKVGDKGKVDINRSF